MLSVVLPSLTGTECPISRSKSAFRPLELPCHAIAQFASREKHEDVPELRWARVLWQCRAGVKIEKGVFAEVPMT